MRYLLILLCGIFLLTGCKKKTSCPNLEGTWVLSKMFSGDISTTIADTSAICEKLVITASGTFVSSSNKTGKVWNSGTYDCSKVFDVTSTDFKKGSTAFYNFYIRR